MRYVRGFIEKKYKLDKNMTINRENNYLTWRGGDPFILTDNIGTAAYFWDYVWHRESGAKKKEGKNYRAEEGVCLLQDRVWSSRPSTKVDARYVA